MPLRGLTLIHAIEQILQVILRDAYLNRPSCRCETPNASYDIYQSLVPAAFAYNTCHDVTKPINCVPHAEILLLSKYFPLACFFSGYALPISETISCTPGRRRTPPQGKDCPLKPSRTAPWWVVTAASVEVSHERFMPLVCLHLLSLPFL